MKKSIIIDTDPGCDDAIAIIIALKNYKKFDIKLISAVGGNIPVKTCTKNALFLVEHFAKKPIPVAMGETSNDSILAQNVHGENGLGNVKIDGLRTESLADGVEAIYTSIMQNKYKTTILTLGPLTNIALLLKTHPDCIKKIDYLFSMAGSMDGSGNSSPYAEFNVYSNPEAFDYVVKSGVKIIFSPVQTGFNCILNKDLILNRKANSINEQIICDIISGAFEPGYPGKFAIFDAQIILGLLFPKLYKFKNCDIQISLHGETRGQTFMNPTTKKSNHKIQIAKNCKKITQKLLEELYK